MQKRSQTNKKNSSQIRQLLAQEAARLMYEEGVSQYFDAKKIAAKRLFGKAGQKSMQYHPKNLPSNGEISAEVIMLADLYETDRDILLLAMRATALSFMENLIDFSPRLIGSVSTGRVRKGSDIDLHVFTDNIEDLEQHLRHLQWDYEKKQIITRQENQFIEYTHIYIEADFPVELSVYPLQNLRIVGRSSTDGQPIKRLKITDVKRL